ncbi:hypothetical protein GCM10010911_43340 [Paenibacillus nasutitermitis]|uniref:Uncharacterized protein n=1 Tax=Paenibacillus nasutitermitis TaxID=1652958 RepID=A0A916Z928_9BACL|nr:hypothetical protein GCM10010911_43340 [Paenibacillus nasutitermitis]
MEIITLKKKVVNAFNAIYNTIIVHPKRFGKSLPKMEPIFLRVSETFRKIYTASIIKRNEVISWITAL